MAERIIMPKQGLQMTVGVITEWLKQEGDLVQEGEPLFEMETDKLAITIDASASGTLLKILCEEGEVVPVAETIAVVGEPGEDIEALLHAPAEKAAEKEAPAAEPVQPEAPVKPETAGRVLATPRARMRAEEKNVPISALTGTGPDGLIIERDVLAYQPAAMPVQTAVTGGDTVIPFTGMRKAISNNMMKSLTTMAQANHRMKVDMTESVRFREKLKAEGVKVSYTDILIKAVSQALLQFPMMNANVEGEQIICRGNVNMGVAVAVEGGLLVPNIKNAQTLSVTQIHEQVAALAEKARTSSLTRDEYSGGTFTITNLGMYEVDEFTPIINPPEVGILGVGAIVDTPCAVNGQVEIRPILVLSLTYDHRVIDGAPAAQFLQTVKKLLQNPYLML